MSSKPTYDIDCVECGAPYTAIRKNAKRCRVCQLCRDVLKSATRKHIKTEECLVCDADYVPLTTDSPPFCGDCDPIKSRLNTEGTCAFCSEKTLVIHEDVQVCKPCSTKPDNRRPLMRALLRKQKERRETYLSAVA